MAQYSANAMKIYNEQIALQSTKPREVVAITTQVKAAMEKSGFRDGIVLVSSLHSNTAIIVNDAEAGLLEDLDNWLTEIAPARDDYKHTQRFESNAAIPFSKSPAAPPGNGAVFRGASGSRLLASGAFRGTGWLAAEANRNRGTRAVAGKVRGAESLAYCGAAATYHAAMPRRRC